jgi:membrane associated rhomboid family serine protease
VFPIRDLNPAHIRPWVTYALIAANIAIFFLWQPQGRGLWQGGSSVVDDTEFLLAHAAIPCEILRREPLTTREIFTGVCGAPGAELFPHKQVLITPIVSMFLHGGLFHLVTNMWVFWIFGNNIEEAYGRVGYLLLYLGAGLVATAGFVLIRPDDTTAIIGASGAIAGVLGAYLVLYPRAYVLSLLGFWLLPVPAWLFLGAWFLFQFATVDPGVAWEAHVFGFVAGAAATALIRPRPRRHQPARFPF